MNLLVEPLALILTLGIREASTFKLSQVESTHGKLSEVPRNLDIGYPVEILPRFAVGSLKVTNQLQTEEALYKDLAILNMTETW